MGRGGASGTHLSVAERQERGRAARRAVPRSVHAAWRPPVPRRDPVALLEEQNVARVPWLVPIRRGRMMVSPLAFFRGAARVMATDLAAATAVSGLTVQACGDAHLANFGVYASPERRLVFDVNDFDETLPGPWEWDVKRLAASFMIGCRQRGLSQRLCDRTTMEAVRGYRVGMSAAAEMRTLDVWYDHLTRAQLRDVAAWSRGSVRRNVGRFAERARSRDHLRAHRQLTVEEGGVLRIRSDPPVLLPLREVPEVLDAGAVQVEADIRSVFEAYTQSIGDDRRVLLDRYRPVDLAVKVVGVGSVGTRCFIMLLEGRDHTDPLFLQVKQATASVLEEHLGPSRYPNSGQRVVEGQRLVQAVSDVLLGWTSAPDGTDYYVRQLRDWKGSVDIMRLTPTELAGYAYICGWTLARGHARSGDPIAIAAYLGRADTFDRAVAVFSAAYAAQNQADHAAFVAAVRDRRLEAAVGR